MMSRVFIGVVTLCLIGSVVGWPGMSRLTADGEVDLKSVIGPPCSAGVHNQLPLNLSGPCPGPQPSASPAPAPPHDTNHKYPSQFVMSWRMYAVTNASDSPPYSPFPSSPYTVSYGQTFYQVDSNGEASMRESYKDRCIPVFVGKNASMAQTNEYSCSFINPASKKTAFVVLYDDRPAGAPECCLIGRPFHAPAQDFFSTLPVHTSQYLHPDYATNSTVLVDWGSAYLQGTGQLSYGFNAATREPYAFFFRGTPWITNWISQHFYDFQPVSPPASTWDIPEACATADPCPGWAAWGDDDTSGVAREF